MKKYELVKLKKQLQLEVERRNRINELLETDLIQEFMKLSGVKVQQLNADNIKEILFSILENFTITETNGIYVCTGTFFTDYDICYEETSYYSREIDFDSKYAEYRLYRDIENGQRIRAYMKQSLRTKKLLTKEFEESNIVLNPYNSSKNSNGYDEVREKFFMSVIEKGQGKAKKLILDQYSRM